MTEQCGDVVARLVAEEGGRFSREMGIDVDAGAREVDRWFLGATLFGTRISAAIAVRTYRSLDGAGISTVADVGRASRETLIDLLDAGGYARYDERTASRLPALADQVDRAFPEGIDAWGRACPGSGELVDILDGLPGWGPVTVRAFLRELRGVWPAVDIPPDERAAAAAGRLGLVGQGEQLGLGDLMRMASHAGLDPRDLEAALVRHDLSHSA